MPGVPIFSRRSRRSWNGRCRTRGANDRLLGLDEEEEYETANEQPRPDQERDRPGLEELLERRPVANASSKPPAAALQPPVPAAGRTGAGASYMADVRAGG